MKTNFRVRSRNVYINLIVNACGQHGRWTWRPYFHAGLRSHDLISFTWLSVRFWITVYHENAALKVVGTGLLS